MSPGGGLAVRRFWAPLGRGHGVVDDDGFLYDPEGIVGRARCRNVETMTDDDLRRCRCLVLLGEPGMGKSTFLARAGPLLPDGCDADVVDFDLAEFGSEDRLVRMVVESDVVTRWLDGSGELCLTLDGFDDAQTRIPHLGSLVAGLLRRWPVDRLWLRIACRTSDWPQPLAAELRRLTRELNVMELLPLRKGDIVALAVEQGVNPQLFLAAVRSRGIGALAARPLTLKFLLYTFGTNNRLPERAGDLYRENLLVLCDEQNLARRAATASLVSPGHLYAVARRVGAVCAFSGVTAVWTGPLPCPIGKDLINVKSLAGGIEPSPGGGDVAVVEPLVRELTRTSLFSSRGTARMGWAHTSFQDFLAADWLLANKLSDHQLRSLLLADDGGVRPQVRRVAAWAVALSPDELGWLTDADPESFVGEVDIPDPGLREVLVDRLIAAADADQVVDGFFTRYSGLAHPGLADQLRPVLITPGPSRWLAIRVIEDCDVADCDEALASIVLDPRAPVDERVAAGWALSYRRRAGHRLLPLVLDETLRHGDDRGELLGVGLLASWPHVLSTEQALDALTATTARMHGGIYDAFIAELTKALTPSDLAAAAAWLLRTKDIESDRFTPVRNACLKLCTSHLYDPAAADAAVATAKTQLLRHGRVLTDDESFPDDARRRLALLVVSAAGTDADADMLAIQVCQSGDLLSPDDFLWLLDHAETAEPAEAAAVYWVLPQLVDESRIDHANAVLSVDHNSPLRPVFDRWLGACDLTDSEIVELRARRRRLQERRAQRDRPRDDIEDRIVRHLDQFESGDVSGYWCGARLVCVRPGSEFFNEEHEPDLTAHRRWDRLSRSVRDRFVDLAPRYLTEGQCAAEIWLGREQRYLPAEAAYRALLLLLRRDPTALDALPATAWQEWAPIIIAWPTTGNGAQAQVKEQLLQHAIPHARQQLRAAMVAVIDEAISTGAFHPIRTEADLVWDDSLQEAVIGRVSGELSNDIRSELATTLLRNAPEAGEALLVSWLGQDPERSNLAAALLLTHRPAQVWPAIHQWLHATPDDASEVLLQLAHGNNSPPELPPQALTDLYLWLWSRFPPSEDPRVDGAHWISQRESVGRFRDRILERLRSAGTDEAVTGIRRIMDTHPQVRWLKRVYAAALAAHRQTTWQPTSPTELRQLAGGRRRRLVRTNKELLEATAGAFTSIQQRLIGETPESHLLWDTTARRPKSEDEISDYLRNRLTDELAGRHVIVNREVEVRRNQPTGIGERTDLRIDAFSSTDDVVTVVIEVKAAWSNEVTTALPTQLVGRYMRDIGTTTGMFVVVWPDIDSWANPAAYVKRRLTHKATLRELLDQQAAERSVQGIEISVIHLDISYRRYRKQYD